MITITELLKSVHDELKLGFRTDFIHGNASENNLHEGLIEMLVVHDKSTVTFSHDIGSGGNTFVYPVRMLFLKLDDLSATDSDHDEIIESCLSVYSQFINRLRKRELVKVTAISGGYVYNDQDANLTGIYVTFTLTINSTDSLCTL